MGLGVRSRYAAHASLYLRGVFRRLSVVEWLQLARQPTRRHSRSGTAAHARSAAPPAQEQLRQVVAMTARSTPLRSSSTFARWFADWWLRRGRRLAAEAQRHADG